MRRRVGRGLVGRALVVGLLATAGVACGAGGDTLTGTIAVNDNGIRTIGDPCSGRRPFLDLRPGASVEVRAADGTVLGTGTIGEGEAIGTHPTLEHLDRTLTACHLPFEVADVQDAAAATELVLGDDRVRPLPARDPAAATWVVEIAIPE